MKRYIVLFFIATGFLSAKSQDYVHPVPVITNSANTRPPDSLRLGNAHKGFYLSMSLGEISGNINDAGNDPVLGNYNIDFSGMGAMFDIKIGGAVAENVIIHATLISTAVSGPTLKGNGNVYNSSNNVSLNEAMTGGGLTYYFMPINIFLSGSIGSGIYTVTANGNSNSTQRGLSYQLKAGKEWYVSRKWGLGIAVSYFSTSVDNSSNGGTETINSGRFAILFNATLN